MKILFIICGSIAIKKIFKILKILRKNKIYVNCIVTESAKKIINIKSLQSSIKGNIYSNASEKNKKMLHINLTRESDLIVVCPATANMIAKFANGYADDLASTSLVAANKKTIIVPAMNVQMWNNSINLNNVNKLKKIGIDFIGPEYGYLSCGEVGLGRLANENKVSSSIIEYINKSNELIGKKCIVTAGGTREPIDSVRYITNKSSGKQGYEIAKQLSLVGANVILITAPSYVPQPTNVKIINVNTSKEMDKAVHNSLPADIAIFAAAVSDIKPKVTQNYKIKKHKLKKILLNKTPDIIKRISSNKTKRPKLVIGFALETNNEIQNSLKKIKSKGCDWIIANKLNKNNQVFGSDYNKIILIKKNKKIKYKKMTKINVAKNIVSEIAKNFTKYQ